MTKNPNTNATILITGAAGFIASCMASFLNKNGFENLILCDDFSKAEKEKNHRDIICISKVERDSLAEYLPHASRIDCIIHFGARTDTTEMDYSIHETLNLNFSKMLWQYCAEKQIPLIYASSAATYGGGEMGYDDNENIIHQLHPLNPYGVSKNEFDKWALQQVNQQHIHPPYWYGLKFFNVYGPNEYHKARMASVIFHAYNQIRKTGKMVLFRSHHPAYKDGEQKRDFIYVKDILKVTYWLMNNIAPSGIYNLGTGNANTFLELASATFTALALPVNIEFTDTPVDIRDKYQYFTEANMQKLKAAGYGENFYTLEEGINDYVSNYLIGNKYL